MLEDDFLGPLLEQAAFAPEENPGFILDIDLDYALTNEVFSPKKSTVFRRLLQHAGLVTLSREDVWLKLLRVDTNWDADKALNAFNHLEFSLL